MKKNLTELVFVIDMSGSMYELSKDTIGGFNSTITQQKAGEGEVLVSTFLFNGSIKRIHDRVSINEITPMTSQEYQPGGCTALIDALGTSIDHISNIHRYIREEDIPENTIFVITTDGYENASHRYTSESVKSMIEKKKSDEKWDFIFLASNIDAVETAKRYGIDESTAVNICADDIGERIKYDTVSKGIRHRRENGRNSVLSSPCVSEWRCEADADFAARRPKNK